MDHDESGWNLRGLPPGDPRCIPDASALEAEIDRLGFLPLFAGGVPGFSVEERTAVSQWWTDDPVSDPWIWREQIAAGGRAAYGKFFGGRAGFLSLEWLPRFANWRRDGYDFDARWDEGLASIRARKIMDLFQNGEERFSFEVKREAGFEKGGEKNFEGVVTSLQMQTYLVLRDFRQRRNRAGLPYGWSIAVYAAPESLWGYDLVTSAYREEPEESRRAVYDRLFRVCPGAAAGEAEALLGK